MDFSFTEEQETISKLARELFERRATPERLTELESGETRYDAALWQELAAVDLLGTATTQHVHGGIGIDITYPLHRYFLWAKHNELSLGPATAQLAHLGSSYPSASEGNL